MSNKRKIAILGATGSIGLNALRVIRAHSDKLELVGIAGHARIEPLAEIAHELGVRNVAVYSKPETETHEDILKRFPLNTQIEYGAEGLSWLATLDEVDMVLISVVGTLAMQPCIDAIQADKMISLATKEILVMAGSYIMPLAEKHGTPLLPIDSEHNAIFQCLRGESTHEIEKVILTASGGRYFDTPIEELRTVTANEAIKHPNWNMGPKNSIDSSTMANKGLELIEAKWLFDLAPEQLDVVIQRQSIIHSMVQFKDGNLIAQLSPTNMSFAIQNCLLFPERHSPVDPPLDFSQSFSLDFASPDNERFPCLKLAIDSLKTGGGATTAFNAANELAVDAFIQNQIGFLDIPRIIELTLSEIEMTSLDSIDAILNVDRNAREISQTFIQKHAR